MTNWNDFARANASERWKQQSAAMGRAATEALIAEAAVREGMHVLDVASGTGEPAISIATQLNASGRVIATDISAGPLEIARKRAASRNLANINFQEADAQQLPFDEAAFDQITCRLGMMFIPDPLRAAREFCRVLKPGGRVSELTWGPFEQPYFQTTIATVVENLPGAQVPPSGAAMFKFSSPAAMTSLFRDAGFADVEARVVTVPWTWPGTAEDVWEYFQDVTAPFKPLLAAIPESKREAVDRAVVDAVRQYETASGIEFSAQFVLASAAKR